MFLFAGVSYYPDGGMGDYVGYFESEEAARGAAMFLLRAGYDWWQIAKLGTDPAGRPSLEVVRNFPEENP